MTMNISKTTSEIIKYLKANNAQINSLDRKNIMQILKEAKRKNNI